MDIDLTTPALLLPAVSLLLLVYANRFLAVAKVIRDLHTAYRNSLDQNIAEQIRALRRRVVLIRNMQGLAISSLFTCVLCMFVLFTGAEQFGKSLFILSLILLLGSLVIAFREIQISVNALTLHLQDIDNQRDCKKL